MFTDKNNYLNQYQLRKNANNKYKKLFMKITTGKRSTDVSLLETSVLIITIEEKNNYFSYAY